VGVAFSLAAFPAFSAAAAAGDRTGFVRLLRTNLITIGGLTALAGVVLFVASTFVIELLLAGERFDAEDVALTSGLLAAFAISVPLESLTYPLARAIYATRNTILPVSASIAGFVATVAATQLLVPAVGLAAVPLGFALGSAVKLCLLAVMLPLRVRLLRQVSGETLSQEA
jgi:putative peptidoglycan lipid II flippase